ncbi:copper transporter [Mycena pura]|uniref:Copper transporter n=1 Tax=Mycena pura TaxID=153505 RepID=A0AAD6Y017_9AGAR|nr:copper transporter [Mycena pura]
MTSTEYSFGDTLHWSFNGSHVLFSFIQLDSSRGFVFGALLTAAICACERLLAYAFEHQWGSARIRRSRFSNALWRTGMYSILTSLRLAYMFIAMTMHIGLILIAVTTLALGQFFVELQMPPTDRPSSRECDPSPRPCHCSYTPLGATRSSYEDFRNSTIQRLRSNPNSDDILHSNFARADSAADRGLTGGAERLQAMSYPAQRETAAWEAGTGPDAARSLLGNTKRGPKRAPFQVGGDDSDDEDS